MLSSAVAGKSSFCTCQNLMMVYKALSFHIEIQSIRSEFQSLSDCFKGQVFGRMKPNITRMKINLPKVIF